MNQQFDHLGYNKELKEYGFTVLRFHDDEIMNDLENVSQIIEH